MHLVGGRERKDRTKMQTTTCASEFSDSDSPEDELDRLIVHYVGGVSTGSFRVKIALF